MSVNLIGLSIVRNSGILVRISITITHILFLLTEAVFFPDSNSMSDKGEFGYMS